jgi:plastocyanin
VVTTRLFWEQSVPEKSCPVAHRRTRVTRLIATGVSAALLICTAKIASANSFTFAPDTSSMNLATYKWTVSIDGGVGKSDPPLTLIVGQTYTFTANTSLVHPFWIKTVQGPTSANAYPTTAGSGLDNNGVSSAATVMTFTVPMSAAGTLYYNCGNHASMTGVISVIVDPIFQDDFEVPQM